MISLILKSYLSLLLSIGTAALLILIAGLYFIFRKPGIKKAEIKKEMTLPPLSPSSDIAAIAGDDVVATQLDLARAYIETNNKQSAKKLLEAISSQGSVEQQIEAQRLLTRTLN